MKSIRLAAISCVSTALLALTGCASITDGTSQVIIFKLDPRETRCTLTREGTELGSVSGRQATISVGKSARDIVVDCKADGHTPKTMRLVSSTQAAGVAGGFFLDLGITDMITGAMWKYQNDVSIILEKDGAAPGQAPAAGAAALSSRSTPAPTDAQLIGGTPSSATPAAAPAPAPAVKAAPAAATSLPSQFSLEAERSAKSQQCGAPTSTLTAKGGGFENYSITCANGDVMSVRCDYGNCRVLR